MQCRICDFETSNELKGIPLCDLHREWAVELMVKIKSAEFEEIQDMLNKLPIRKAEPCEK